jgi:rhodanese-related sulfurtransferase
MRDNNRKHSTRHLLAALLLGGIALRAAPLLAEKALEPVREPCSIIRGVIGELGQPTRDVSTYEMEHVVADPSALVLDARPHEEFAMSHIAGALNVAPKPGLAMSQYTSDVAEIERLTKGDKRRTIVLYCNGPFCGKSKRVAADLVAAGYTGVLRYQLGIPVWRALGHATQSEAEAIRATLEKDKTAVVIDAREAAAFQAGTIPGARNVRSTEVAKAKDDGRLPMLDHNTRIFVAGKDEAEARAAAQEIAKNAFHNVSFFAGPIEALMRIPSDSGSR